MNYRVPNTAALEGKPGLLPLCCRLPAGRKGRSSSGRRGIRRRRRGGSEAKAAAEPWRGSTAGSSRPTPCRCTHSSMLPFSPPLSSVFFLFFFFWIGCGSCMCVCNERNWLRNPSLCGCAAGDSPPSVIVRRSVEGTPLVASAWGFPPLVVPVSPLVESND